VVGEWQDAANRKDADRLVELSAPDIEVVGPRGSGHGSGLLRDWLERAGLQVQPHRVFTRAAAVVVEQDAVWQDPDGRPAGAARIASTFEVQGGVVTRFARHDTLDDALAAAGLTSADEIFRG
jgi:hypothetical protein